MFQQVFNLQKVTPSPFLPSKKIEFGSWKPSYVYVGSVLRTPFHHRWNWTVEIQYPKWRSHIFWSRGDTPLSPNSSSSFLRTDSLNFGGGVVFSVPTLFLKWDFHWPCIDRSRCRCYATLASATWFFLQSRTLEAMVGWDDLIVCSFLDGVHLHPSGQSEMNTSRLTRCSKCDKGALLLCFFNLGNLEMIEWILSICQFPNCVS